MKRPQILDRFGRPLQRSVLTKEVSAATIGGVRSPVSGYPADGLDPVRLASILRAADQGDPVQFLELAEIIEERDMHYLGVIGTRKRSVSQIPITVKAASDKPEDVKKAEMVQEWLERGELIEELFDILDAVGKGYSFTEILWDSSMGQWRPDKLEYRDPRWFRFNRHDFKTPMQLDDYGQEKPLDAFKFIFAQVKAKSGLPIRSGLARAATWGYLFKKYTERDWAIFTQTYGQPLRVGKWGEGASEADKNTLFDAVANIAGDCAAIIPDSMTIDFVEAKSANASSDLYLKRVEHLDQQISKAVLGQTGTTDAVVGGLGSGKEHRQVQEDIERADAGTLAAILNRDLIRPWMDLEFGPQEAYPTLVIARPEQEDLKTESEIVGNLFKIGLPLKTEQLYAKFGYEKPKGTDEVLGQIDQNGDAPADAGDCGKQTSKIKRFLEPIKHPKPEQGTQTAQQALQASQGDFLTGDDLGVLADQLQNTARPQVAAMMGQIEAMMAQALTSSFAGGHLAIEEESRDA
jgi:phage gp29-like protein